MVIAEVNEPIPSGEFVEQPVKSVSLYAKVIRKDGTEEGEKLVAYWHRNPLMRLWMRHVRGVKGVVDKRPDLKDLPQPPKD